MSESKDKSPLAEWIRSRTVYVLAAVLVSGLSIYLAFSDVSFKDVLSELRLADWRLVSLALVSVLANNLLKVFRWQVLLGDSRKAVGFLNTSMALMSGQLLNIVFPARIGDISRALAISQATPGKLFVLGGIALEKIIDFLFYGFLFLILIFLVRLPGWMSNSGYLLSGAAFLAAILAVLAAYNEERLAKLVEWIANRFPDKIRSRIISAFRSGMNSLSVLKRRRDLFWLAFWTGLIWLTAIITNQLTMLALDIHLPISASILLLVALQAGISLPSVPGKIGIFEYISVLVLSLYGIGQSEALGYGILLHGLVFLPVILLGLLSFWFLGLKDQRTELFQVTEGK